PYVEIADSIHINTMLSIIQHQGYYFYGWMGNKNGNNETLQIQGLRDDGTLLFNQGSILLSNNPGVTTYIPIIPSDSGSCVFISSYAEGTFGQKIDTLGFLRWNSNQVLLNYPQLGLDHSYATSDCFGGAIGLGDYLTDFAIPVFKVSSKGILGEIITNVISTDDELIPRAPLLLQNFPNPFNSATIIKYQIADESNVKISLYNVLGERLKILSNEFKSVGTHSIIMESDDLPSGVYIYTLETNQKVLTKKLIIIK
ncbi:T9SS type A sorting domain-containing protein, partial [Ignavibacterium sp.]|uniref:T9SS type A sorting domain-containing protein n=1 Tax=Ignavibacterium sp. TaxID=2651167 RepID=UPI00307F7E6E